MNILVINPSNDYAEMLADNGQRLVIIRGTFRDLYGARVLLQSAIGGVVDGDELDLRDEVTLFRGQSAECYNYLVRFAKDHFSAITVNKELGTAKQKCECGGPRYVDYGEKVCPTCIEQAIAHEAGIPF